MSQPDIENIIRILAYNGVGLGDAMKELGLNRNQFNGRRRSTSEATKATLAKEVMGAYPKVFPGGRLPAEKEAVDSAEKDGDDFQAKYIALLEQNLRDARLAVEENTRAMEVERERLLREILEILERVEKREKE